MSHVIIKGNAYMDIDMVAGIQALYEVLTLKGKEVFVNGTQTYSASVTEELKKSVSHIPEKDIEVADELYLVDLSETDYLKQCGYPLDQIVQIFDHHFDSTEYWKERLGDKAVIEEIGAAATLVAEYAKEDNLFSELTADTKKLIAAAIVSNSQNFKLSMTKERDHAVYNEISQELGFSEKWAEEYLLSVQDEVIRNIDNSLANDTKLKTTSDGRSVTIAQIEMWNTSLFLEKHKNFVTSFLSKQRTDLSFFMSASLSEDKTYFIVKDEDSKKYLSDLLDITFTESVAVYHGVIIRKEVVRLMLR